MPASPRHGTLCPGHRRRRICSSRIRLSLLDHHSHTRSGIPWVSTVPLPASVWSAFDFPFVPPNAPWLHKVFKAVGPLAARLYMKSVKVMSDSVAHGRLSAPR